MRVESIGKPLFNILLDSLTPQEKNNGGWPKATRRCFMIEMSLPPSHLDLYTIFRLVAKLPPEFQEDMPWECAIGILCAVKIRH